MRASGHVLELTGKKHEPSAANPTRYGETDNEKQLRVCFPAALFASLGD
jgi:hypothetical protein